MKAYILRRLLLIPVTLFSILLVNFIILNLAPGDPTTITQISPEGGAERKADRSYAGGGDLRWLEFRERYGLTLPVLINLWPWESQEQVDAELEVLNHPEKMSVKVFDEKRITFGDKARFIMPKLLVAMENPALRPLAIRFFVRGGIRPAIIGSDLTEEETNYNRKIAEENDFLLKAGELPPTDETVKTLHAWYEKNATFYHFDPHGWEKYKIIFETRLVRYLSKVLTLDFGTLRNDTTKSVITEVTRRFKYSLTLSLVPMIITFFLCQIFGLFMTVWHNRLPDMGLNVIFLILYAIPIFVVAPFLIEKVALNHTFPFTDIPIPIGGFSSPQDIYSQMTTQERLMDVLRHICLPLIAIMYGSLAASSRLSRTAFLEVSRQDFIRFARAKGVSPFSVLVRHIGRAGSITIVTSIAGSLGVVLGGSLIVEILFEINGFGKFFYDAVINRDFNVILFSAIAGSFLTLIGYLLADIAYTILDPRVNLT